MRDDDRRGKRQMLEPDTQPNAPSALVDLSTPPPGGLGLGFAQEYYFDPAAGRGSTIYIIDTGANPNNDVSDPFFGPSTSLNATGLHKDAGNQTVDICGHGPECCPI